MFNFTQTKLPPHVESRWNGNFNTENVTSPPPPVEENQIRRNFLAKIPTEEIGARTYPTKTSKKVQP